MTTTKTLPFTNEKVKRQRGNCTMNHIKRRKQKKSCDNSIPNSILLNTIRIWNTIKVFQACKKNSVTLRLVT